MIQIHPTPSCLTAREVSVFRSGKPIFTKLSTVIFPGQALRLVGPNGCGKSTVLRLFAGLLSPIKGNVYWANIPIKKDLSKHVNRVAYLGHKNAIKFSLTARENAKTLLTVSGRYSQSSLDRAFKMLELEHLAGLPAGLLSEGQRNRVSLARVIASFCPLWLLDEPTTGLDSAATNALENAISLHLSDGGMVIFATHSAINLGQDDKTLDPSDFACSLKLWEDI
ncbi:heme ABC exporter, ATP-binding protein CcmA [Candidatus Endolissoclinum faulkneri L5]|uniref:Heme ABC exporter, ATP-binding protein CcmA n=1 Tax=Candidatus Endolissoclinum faulkneri L5 TaxID=1401328 RepID=V9TSH3_9PROT|nr:heme ABC exporter ATP-binding protein CcmA [Candidatus Endolissoclinum faulkneri]AHC73541.1 heme ABC exporter, ATP-binding protein CcmA [Candidatus Endolissoclinum faulkneri L5]